MLPESHCRGRSPADMHLNLMYAPFMIFPDFSNTKYPLVMFSPPCLSDRFFLLFRLSDFLDMAFPTVSGNRLTALLRTGRLNAIYFCCICRLTGDSCTDTSDFSGCAFSRRTKTIVLPEAMLGRISGQAVMLLAGFIQEVIERPDPADEEKQIPNNRIPSFSRTWVSFSLPGFHSR